MSTVSVTKCAQSGVNVVRLESSAPHPRECDPDALYIDRWGRWLLWNVRDKHGQLFGTYRTRREADANCDYSRGQAVLMGDCSSKAGKAALEGEPAVMFGEKPFGFQFWCEEQENVCILVVDENDPTEAARRAQLLVDVLRTRGATFDFDDDSTDDAADATDGRETCAVCDSNRKDDPEAVPESASLQDGKNLTQECECESYGVLMLPITLDWKPKAYSSMPPWLESLPYEVAYAQAEQFNCQALDRSLRKWACLARLGQNYAVVTVELPQAVWLADPSDFPPQVCSTGLESFGEARDEAYTENRRIREMARSPRLWAIPVRQLHSLDG